MTQEHLLQQLSDVLTSRVSCPLYQIVVVAIAFTGFGVLWGFIMAGDQ